MHRYTLEAGIIPPSMGNYAIFEFLDDYTKE